jgi:hypothetical protein
MPVTDRPQHGDVALPLLEPAKKAESKNQAVTSLEIKTKGDVDLDAEKARWVRTLLGTGKAG